jgi:hypothetical protein
MLRARHARSMPSGAPALVVAACLGLVFIACQGPDEFLRGVVDTGPDGSILTGAGGNVVTGAGGDIVTGTGGSIVSGAGGNSGGSPGTGGSTGSGGRGGSTGGTSGAAGRGGSTGAGGAAGRGGTSGTTGGAGRGGTGGTAGAAGRGGRGGATGAAGNRGTAGAGGNSCPLGGRLDCTTAGSLKLADGQVADFSAAEWNNTAAKWCDADGLDGGLSSYAGTPSTAAAAVDATAQNLKLNLMVVSGGYAGGRVNFDSCVDARAFNSVQFTASVSAGSLAGCSWQVQVQTQDQRPSTLTNPTGGTCNSTTTTCERYPVATLAAATATATTYTVRFSSFNNPSTSAIATPSQIVGLQWQVDSSGGACTVELRIDSIKFVTQ